ncbi:MAG: twin-arginine translocation signal domain-containing protein [Candidatus Poribacteria bacterium]|nr:twin-arginine translocation signal domain-containing protein [Candidatus Poribacteria bacterium]
MISRRSLLKGFAATAIAAIAAPALTIEDTKTLGLASPKPEGGVYYPAPAAHHA